MNLPFNLGELTWTTHLSLDAAPGTRAKDRRVRLEAHVASLVSDKAVAAYVRAIAGSHYRARTDRLTIACEQHPDAGANRREALERLVSLVSEAQRLSAQYGPFPRARTLPRYAH